MRKQIKVIGITHKQGKTRDGNLYDFNVLHAIYSDDNTEGDASVSVTIPDDVVPTVKIGNEYFLFTHFYNGRERFDVILPV